MIPGGYKDWYNFPRARWPLVCYLVGIIARFEVFSQGLLVVSPQEATTVGFVTLGSSVK